MSFWVAKGFLSSGMARFLFYAAFSFKTASERPRLQDPCNFRQNLARICSPGPAGNFVGSKVQGEAF